MKILIVLLLALVTVTVQAQNAYPISTSSLHPELGTFQPYLGTYYDPAAGGTGIQVDLGQNGSSFVTYYAYSSTGAPSWYILQANFVPTDETTRWKTGVIGMMSGPLYQAFNGQCLGCPYTPNGGAVVTPYTATLTWTGTRTVKVEVGGNTFHMVAPNFDGGSDGDYLNGSWATTVESAADSSGNPKYVVSAVLSLTPTDRPVVIDAAASNVSNMPANAKTFVASCHPNTPSGHNLYCKNFSFYLAVALGTNYPIFWFDQATNRIGMDIATLQTVGGQEKYVIGSPDIHFDVYLKGSNELVGRGVFEGPSNASYPSGSSAVRISMVKMPGAAIAP